MFLCNAEHTGLASSAWKGLCKWLRLRAERQADADLTPSTHIVLRQMVEALPIPAQPSPGILNFISFCHTPAHQLKERRVQALCL